MYQEEYKICPDCRKVWGPDYRIREPGEFSLNRQGDLVFVRTPLGKNSWYSSVLPTSVTGTMSSVLNNIQRNTPVIYGIVVMIALINIIIVSQNYSVSGGEKLFVNFLNVPIIFVCIWMIFYANTSITDTNPSICMIPFIASIIQIIYASQIGESYFVDIDGKTRKRSTYKGYLILSGLAMAIMSGYLLFFKTSLDV